MSSATTASMAPLESRFLSSATDRPWRKLPKRQRDQLLWGTGERVFRVTWQGKSGEGSMDMRWEGVVPRLTRRFRQTGSERAKRWYAQFIGDAACSACAGTRLRRESASVRVGGRTIVEVSADTNSHPRV